MEASRAHLLDALQSCQVLESERTWVGKWSLVTRVSAGLKGVEEFGRGSEFGFVMAILCQARTGGKRT